MWSAEERVAREWRKPRPLVVACVAHGEFAMGAGQDGITSPGALPAAVAIPVLAPVLHVATKPMPLPALAHLAAFGMQLDPRWELAPHVRRIDGLAYSALRLRASWRHNSRVLLFQLTATGPTTADAAATQRPFDLFPQLPPLFPPPQLFTLRCRIQAI